jgi:hypothetical protein
MPFASLFGLLVYRIINHTAEAAGWDMAKEVERGGSFSRKWMVAERRFIDYL